MRFAHVFITGASSGLGRGLALHYAREGATVHAVARRRPELEQLAHDAAGTGAGGRVVPVPLDVCDADALAAAVRAAEDEGGGALDLVVANAGVGGFTPGKRMDWRLVKRILDVNVSSAAVTIAAALPAMVARGSGTVAAVASLAGFRGLPNNAAYCASKAALHTFMESVRVDLRGTGVNAVTIYPGFVRTPMTADNGFPMPFIMELDDAVRAMARGIDRGEARVSFPLAFAAAVRALGALPAPVYDALVGMVPSRKRRKRTA